MTDTLIQQGLTLMLAGMGTVFVFLIVLVVAINVMAAITRRFLQSAAVDASDEEIAAITAAIARHRNK